MLYYSNKPEKIKYKLKDFLKFIMSFESERVIKSTVPPEIHAFRLDRYLTERFTYFSRTQWERNIRDGLILLNGRRVRPSKLLNGGEVIEFRPPPEATEPDVRTDYTILMETAEFLAVNKPPDLPVHPAGCYFRNTLSMLLREEYGVVHPVNRLDRETSGVTLFARTPEAAGVLSRSFLLRNPEKIYTAFVFGTFPEEMTAEGFLSPDEESPVRKKRKFTRESVPDGESCKTFFRLLSAEDDFSVVECRLETGRLHQIRATLCSLGYPLLGDKMYGPDPEIFIRYTEDRMTAEDRALLRLDHQALHAGSLRFMSPFDGEEIVLHAEMPSDMQKMRKNKL